MEWIDAQELIQKGLELGFDDVGLCQARIPQPDLDAWRHWLDLGLHADLSYMEQAARSDPRFLLEGAQSAIVFISYYKPAEVSPPNDGQVHGRIAAYARGRDYHHVHRKRLKQYVRWLDERSQFSAKSRGFSDSAPLLEKALAVQSGLGWFGKNTLLIHRKFGTYTLLSVVLTTLKTTYYSAANLRSAKCGSCTLCLDHCPTNALKPYLLDANQCLSYHTIESKKPIPDAIAKRNPGLLFGCDICQQVCPHNSDRKPPANTDEFMPEKGLGAYLSQKQLQEMPAEKLWGTPLQRRKLEGLLHTFDRLVDFDHGLNRVKLEPKAPLDPS